MKSDDFAHAVISLLGRQAFSAEQIVEIVVLGAGGGKQLAAYNLCDGSRSQGEVAKIAALDPGNFSRTVSRWIDEGIVFKVGEGKDSTLLHVFAIPQSKIREFERHNK